jgi:hypothetical protein
VNAPDDEAVSSEPVSIFWLMPPRRSRSGDKEHQPVPAVMKTNAGLDISHSVFERH